MKVCALIVAAGRGSRAAAPGSSGPKQYAGLGGKALLAWTVKAFASHPRIDLVQVVIHPDDRELYNHAVGPSVGKLARPVFGGASRQSSVLAGLEAVAAAHCEQVLIHDAARPFIGADVIDRVLAGLSDGTGAIAAIKVADTLKRALGDQVGDDFACVKETVPRDGLWRAQTPQGFSVGPILAAHRKAAQSATGEFTDDASIAEWAGLRVRLVEGSIRNDKITTAEDLVLARNSIRGAIMEPRVGSGFDVHKFGPGESVWLCGVEIAHDKALIGHSDADVGLHALTDAVLGALGDGDIGHHFPPSDPQWLGARSEIFLKHAGRLVADAGGRIGNVDVTLMCEEPKVGPHRDAMRAAIAEILEIDIGRVGVKATTTERLGFTGRGEGIAAIASALVMLPCD
ncbi:MAG: bifunctional 2-C-methyl-D-erythritol 4-phosphate cytidylyltransferase/2-C-methyl-D-erythritol 2,4-cyclodiphosphate synthase [Alphaproteobacteria bacterium]|nr:bifunctional 2-C-methyl-D-erythritol 4-phosphate cytidylyltransferase/2-C-methyl-D-erythritol 2,4-cyclodiphosphate synthase [Alphaproteobacteria bacterium]